MGITSVKVAQIGVEGWANAISTEKALPIITDLGKSRLCDPSLAGGEPLFRLIRIVVRDTTWRWTRAR